MFNKLLNNVKDTALLPFLGVLSDRLYKISSKKLNYQLIPASDKQKFAGILLSRQHYHEVQKSYPVESKKELKKILKLELNGEKQIALYRIGDYKNKQRVVTFAYLSDKALNQYPQLKQFMCVPESWLIGVAYSNKLVKVASYKSAFWLYHSSEKTQSHQVKGLFSSSAAFCAAVGVSNSVEAISISELDVITLFRKNCISLLVEHKQGLWVTKGNQSKFDFLQIMPAVLSCFAILIIYTYGMSYYLEYQLENQQVHQNKLVKNAGELFLLQKSIEKQSEKINMLEQTLQQQGVPLALWQNLQPLYKKENVRFKKVTALTNNVITIMVEAPKATDILELLGKQQSVYEAKFKSDIVKKKELENFTISYNLVDKTEAQ